MPQAPHLPVLKRLVDKAAQWSVNNQHTLDHYLNTVSAGKQYAGYFSLADVNQADAQAYGGKP